jgi:general stress protein CsbA
METKSMNFKKLTKMQFAALFIIFIMVVSGVAGFLLIIFSGGM